MELIRTIAVIATILMLNVLAEARQKIDITNSNLQCKTLDYMVEELCIIPDYKAAAIIAIPDRAREIANNKKAMQDRKKLVKSIKPTPKTLMLLVDTNGSVWKLF